MHVHFMGIGGSGMSAVAQIAAAQGFEISGCDLQTDTPYLTKIKKLGCPLHQGHDAAHLAGVDILAVTPAVFYQNPDHPEVVAAKQAGKLMTWQQFMGQYLHKDKTVICVAGTHGKSTTTTMAGLVLEASGLDPTVEVGATVPVWQSNMRLGQGEYFVSEADEYYENFLHYHPDIVILNNIELDHPEYFKDLDQLIATYVKFVKNIKSGGTLIYNLDDPDCQTLVSEIQDAKIAIVGYSLSEFPKDLTLGIPGNHNRSNSMGVIKLAKLLHLDDMTVFKTLHNFTGIGRRLELLGESHGIKVYDDYANLPTAFAANIAAIKDDNPQAKIWTIIEPHTYSRLRAVLDQLPDALKAADEIIVSKVFASREVDPGNFSGQDIADAAKGRYIPEFSDIVHAVQSEVKTGDVILVMGSGDSYKLARAILAAV